MASWRDWFPLPCCYNWLKTIICQISLWEPRSGTLLIKIRGHEDSVNELQFYPVISSKSVPIIFSVGDNSCRVWHPLRKRGKQLQMIKQHRLGLEVCLLSQVAIIYFFCSNNNCRIAATHTLEWHNRSQHECVGQNCTIDLSAKKTYHFGSIYRQFQHMANQLFQNVLKCDDDFPLLL